MPVPGCCMFFVSHNIHIKQSPNAIKLHGDYFLEYMYFWGRRTSGRGGPHAPQVHRARPEGLWPPRKPVWVSFGHKKENI